MKKNLILLIVIIAFYSCKKSNVSPNGPAKMLPDSNIVVSSPQIGPVNSALNIDKTYNLLGYGYDITGKYADTSAVRSQAINMAAYDANNPGRVSNLYYTMSTFHIINAQNAESFSEQLSSGLAASNGLKLFKGSLVSVFPDVNALSSKYVYGNYTVIIQQKLVKMDVNYDLLKQSLSTGFVHDIGALNAADLVKKYGTHVLSDITLGAKFNVTYQAQTSSDNPLASESAGFRYAIGKVFGLFTGELDPIDSLELDAISSPRLVYEAEGADQSKLQLNTTSKTATLDITNWLTSSTEDSAVFIDISENGLIPLYELISDPIKQAAVKLYITNYLAAQQVKLVN